MQESGEMYLETILILGKRSNTVRAVNVAEEMRISKASVSRALSRLKGGAGPASEAMQGKGRDRQGGIRDQGTDLVESSESEDSAQPSLSA